MILMVQKCVKTAAAPNIAVLPPWKTFLFLFFLISVFSWFELSVFSHFIRFFSRIIFYSIKIVSTEYCNVVDDNAEKIKYIL